MGEAQEGLKKYWGDWKDCGRLQHLNAYGDF